MLWRKNNRRKIDACREWVDEPVIAGQRDRAVDAAVALEQECARIRAENEALTELVESLRWRIFMLLRSTDVDAEVFGLPKYSLAEVPEDAHEEELLEPDWREAYNELVAKYRTGNESCKYYCDGFCKKHHAGNEPCMWRLECGFEKE